MLVLTVAIVAINSSTLLPGRPWQLEPPSRRAVDFQLGKCETSVATDPTYVHFQNGVSIFWASYCRLGYGRSRLISFIKFSGLSAPETREHRRPARPCPQQTQQLPEIELSFGEDTGVITVHYPRPLCLQLVDKRQECNCGRLCLETSHDNYSVQLGQFERRKFHVVSEKDVQEVQSAFTQICSIVPLIDDLGVIR